jgi:D-methionine transport system substrate-binding protein
MKRTLCFLASLLLVLSSLPAIAQAETVKVKIGVVGENNEQWEQVIIPTLKEEGIEIELVKFSDYVIPNQALADGEVDLNAFQHYNFMNKWSSEHGVELVAIAETLIAPLCIYSQKITSLDEVQEGDGVAIMNDVVNEARALRMLASTGLITLKEDISELATVADIVENPKNLQFYEMEAAMTASSLHDPLIAFGFLNGTHAKDAGYTNDQALLMEAYDPGNPDMRGIINVIAARADRAEDPVFARIAEVYHSDEVKALFETVYKGVYIPAWE